RWRIFAYSDHENVGAEADFNNLETTITVSPIPITRTHKAHPISQIIGDILFAQGHTQEEGIDYEEVFAPVARIEAIRLFLAYASFMGFMVYQIDVKSAFLYGTIEEEVYVCQPLGFEDPDHPDKVYKVVKGLYGLHQAPRACQDKYVAEILKKFGLTEEKSASTPIDTEKPLLKDPDGEDVDVHIYKSMIVKRIFRYLKGKSHLGLWYPKDSPFDLVAYSGSDYAGASLDRKSTTGGCQFLGCRLISWQCKKQTIIATSSTEVEFVAGTSCCAQVLWIQNQMLDYRHKLLLFSLTNWCCSISTVRSSRFEDPDHPDKVYKVVKALYGLHQAPRACQDKYVAEILKKFGFTKEKPASTPIDTEKPLLKDPDGEDVDVHIYRSMIGSLMYLTSSRPDIMFASNDVTRLQALVNKKKVVVTEAAIRDALCLDDAKGVDCLPNEEIFTELARMGYEKPSTKLTFYKAFFSSQWKFLIHIILQSMSAKRTSWNEFSSAMASAVICLSIGRNFNFSKYIFDSLVRNVDSSSKFYMYPRFIHLIIQNQLGDLSTHTTKYISPALTQKVFANMRRVGKGCSGVETPLSGGMLVAREPEEQGDAEEQGNDDNAAEEPNTAISEDDVEDQSIPSPTPPTPPPQQPQDIPSTSQAQSPSPQPQSPTPTQPQGADFPMSLLQEALDACVALARRVEHLKHDKVAQDLEIIKLKTMVKKLKRANKVKALKLRRLRKVGTSQRVDTSDDTIMEDVSNQGRIIDELDKDEGDVLMNEKEETKEVRDNTGDAQVRELV
nr:hypothetical protein [Tanacetum cinerariifolium]